MQQKKVNKDVIICKSSRKAGLHLNDVHEVISNALAVMEVMGKGWTAKETRVSDVKAVNGKSKNEMVIVGEFSVTLKKS